MQSDDFLNKVEINNDFSYSQESALNQMLNDYYLQMDEKNKLINHSKIVGMDQIAISSLDKYIIGTQALDTCFGILFYDRRNKFGIVGHADPTSIIPITIKMLKQIPNNTTATIEYCIIPGYRAVENHNFKGIEDIISILHHYSSLNSNIKFTTFKTSINPTMPKGLLCYDFAFDTQTGKDVSSIIFSNHLEEQNKRHI